MRALKWVVPVQDAPQEVGAGPVIAVQVQHGVPCLWTLEPDETSTDDVRQVAWAGTGHPTVPAWATPIGTVQMHDGALVFHLFDVTPPVG